MSLFEMNPVKLGIAMIPDSQTLQKIIKLQQQVSVICPLQPTLAENTNLPHMTLLQGRFSNLAAVRQLIHDLKQHLQQIYSQQPEVFTFHQLKCIYKAPGWYFLQPNPDTIGHQAHQICFDALKNIMVLLECDRQKNMVGYTTSETSNYKQYGYRYIEKDFYPHLTLGQTINRSASEKIDSWMKSLPAQQINISGRFERITLYRVGDFGSHAESLVDLEIGI
ncbi:hypothetical protein NIES267_27920 [Calothrix parasitica NIES-267]|uniref:2',5' RNA ligase n=1 Tax=Calothrix parasitica NIES-267 TaxID=1973488 RepID=A0A1Z4LPY9_9CYAN|nr:hypothetical protein NIES267_27920 [Calothrix parasitica NIES-267]